MSRSLRGLLLQVIDSLWLTLLFTYIILGIFLTPFHGDESTQIYMSRDFFYHIVQGDTARVMYQDWDNLSPEEATQQDLRLKDGTVAKYLYGASAYLYGYSLEDLNDQWVWGSGWDWNHDNGHVPSEGLLIRTRIASAILLASGVVVLYTIAFQTAWRIAAYCASLIYTISPALLLNGRRAMMEGGLAFFSLLVVLAGMWVIEQRSRWSYIWLGLFSGLAVSTKHSAVATVVAVIVACVTYFIYQGLRTRTISKGLRQTALVIGSGIIALVVFYALNPVWWSDPVSRASDVIQIRREFVQAQIDSFGGYNSFSEKTRGFVRQTFGMENMYTETTLDNFQDNLADDIVLYENSLYRGLLVDDVPALPYILFGLSVIGALMLALDSGMPPALRWLVIIWALVMVVFTLLVTPLEWQRYYLPAYPVVALLVGYGIRYIFFLLSKLRLFRTR